MDVYIANSKRKEIPDLNNLYLPKVQLFQNLVNEVTMR